MKSNKAKFFCENCGSEVGERERFCKKCGKFFISVRCPQCGFTGRHSEFNSGCPCCGYAENSIIPKAPKPTSKAVKSRGSQRVLYNGRITREQAPLPTWVYVFCLTGILFIMLIVHLCVIMPSA